MAPVCTENGILRIQRLANPDRYRFLANRQMYGTFYFICWIDTRNFFFYTANPVQRSVKPLRHFFSQHIIPSSRFLDGAYKTIRR